MLYRVVKFSLITVCKCYLTESDAALLEVTPLNINCSSIIPAYLYFLNFSQGEVSPSSTTGSGIEEHEVGPTGVSRDAGTALEWGCVL